MSRARTQPTRPSDRHGGVIAAAGFASMAVALMIVDAIAHPTMRRRLLLATLGAIKPASAGPWIREARP